METLLKSIQRGELRPGDSLPSQRELVAQLGLSRSAIREALRGLASIGVIEILPGRGVFVRQITPEIFRWPDAVFSILQRDTLLHTLEVRKILEVEAIALAAERATEEDLKELERILKRIKEGLSSPEKPFRHSPYFHVAIANAAHNPVLANMLHSLVRLLARGAEVIAEHVPEAKETEYRSHAELYAAILRRNPEKARASMLRHLEHARKLILRGFSEIHSAQPDDSAEARAVRQSRR